MAGRLKIKYCEICGKEKKSPFGRFCHACSMKFYRAKRTRYLGCLEDSMIVQTLSHTVYIEDRKTREV